MVSLDEEAANGPPESLVIEEIEPLQPGKGQVVIGMGGFAEEVIADASQVIPMPHTKELMLHSIL